jgi:PadR family transcriptional regulator AphA
MWNVPSVVLTPVSYLVLGLVAREGAATPYDLKRLVARSIGYFWSFPHSQLYAEPDRLAREGLLQEEREETGRRRRVYSLTPAGREALTEWLRQPVSDPPQLRDLGLLKLFFGELLEPDEVRELARAQEASHRARLDHYRELEAHLAGRDDLAYPFETLRMGILCEDAFVRFWSGVAAEAVRPRAAAARRGARAGGRTS